MDEYPWHRRFHRDLISGRIGMRPEVRACLDLLLDHMFAARGPIRNEPEKFALQLGIRVRTWNAIFARLVARGDIHMLAGGMLSSSEIVKELAWVAEQQRTKAERTANARRRRAEIAAQRRENNNLADSDSDYD